MGVRDWKLFWYKLGISPERLINGLPVGIKPTDVLRIGRAANAALATYVSSRRQRDGLQPLSGNYRKAGAE